MKVAVDAMGGDNAPDVNIEGAVEAAKLGIAEIVLVGNKDIIEPKLNSFDIKGLPISIYHTTQVIEMHESPAQACRQKKDSSIMVCAQLVAEKKVDAYVSAGNSGAAMTSSLLNLKRLNGIRRPAIASVMPTVKGKCIILDVGANVDSKPEDLLQYAIMGNIYVKHVYDIPNPKIGLLSIGEENSKGNELSLEAFELIKQTDLNFVGNIEGRDIPKGTVDIVVCDGFVGNVVLKLAEGIAFAVLTFLKEEILKNIIRKFGYILLRGAFKSIKKKIDFNEYGGAPLLGINGVTIICHGISNGYAIKNAIKVAVEFVKHDVNKEISEEISKLNINIEQESKSE
jgi:phosphate acyltransferase